MNMKKNKKKLTSFFILCLLVALVGYWNYSKPRSPYHLEVFQTEDKGYGYKICEGTHTFIMQPFIPVIAGKKSFRTADDATHIGTVVLERLEAGENLYVSHDDLERWKIDLSD